MDAIELSEPEINYFTELFKTCESRQSNIAVAEKVTNLFVLSGLPSDILQLIFITCGISAYGVEKTQFFVALKLIAAAQAGKSVSLQNLNDKNTAENLPLPRFNVYKSRSKMSVANNNNADFDESPPTDAWENFDSEDCRDDKGLLGNDGNSSWTNVRTDSSSVTSSETDSMDDIWTITDEQRDYYTKQFHTMQPDRQGSISGAVAKDYFEKSRLPVHELAKIWQLSDLNGDGLLSLEEFCIAMHLVVLRRNKIDLPDSLPSSLTPYVPLSEEPFASDLPQGSTMKRISPPSPVIWQQVIDSRSSSAVSSPSVKPTNFDFAPIAPDPVTNTAVNDETARPRPTPKKAPPDGSTANVILPPPITNESSKHARSSSMDNTLSGENLDLTKSMPPAVPPRPVGSTSVTAYSSLEKATAKQTISSLERHRRAVSLDYNRANLIDSERDLSQQLKNANRKELISMLRKQKRRNSTLTRLNTELNQELQEVMEQRIALEIQLEHLRPFT
ncbi:DgyrCDS6038 [Dimorphilus gyrociliatus]|uniref:DgyrCDS6038 n=1 Tax=Dimorphilus gyrociliatus TaxID=2664684 RepID=A0A7I8VLS7_9ANNE|nr:DgyrCDS6038 [Dimorphilus gyrociliatus]